MSCLCNECKQKLKDNIVDIVSKKCIMVGTASECNDNPGVEVQYVKEDGNIYWEMLLAEVKFCCECGCKL